jgi:hypothetical protein
MIPGPLKGIILQPALPAKSLWGYGMDDQGFLPDRIVAGETIWIASANTIQAKADIVFPFYTPNDGYTLAYSFGSSTPITVSGVANGSGTGWTLEVASAQTLAWKPGTIRFSGLVTHTVSTRSYNVDLGSIAVNASPLATSQWTAIVTACDAAILTYAATPHGSFTVDGFSVTFRSLSQLTDLRAYARNMADLETGNRQKRIIRSRFT